MTAGGLLALLLVGACGRPDASPTPDVTLPTSPSSAAPTSVPAVASISVRPVATTPPPTVKQTTAPPPAAPPPVQVQPVPEVPRTTSAPPTNPFEEFALEGFPCEAEGEAATDPAGRPLVCEKTRRGKLRWARS
jgi:hypothetical protein